MRRARLPSLGDPETAGAAVLIAAALVALAWANSPWRASYSSLWAATPPVGARMALREWVDDALMAVFFFTVGLEIKREAVAGPLRDRRTAALPVVAAVGGMVVPAAVYLLVTLGHGESQGWAVPMATDIAFAVGVLALGGPRVAPPLKLFLLTLAVVDDIGAILVIAVVYTSELQRLYLLDALAVAVVVVAIRRTGRLWLPLHIALGVVLWATVRSSGVHPTIAGVALALLTPTAAVTRLETRLRPWTTFAVLPLFAVANAGVRLRADIGHAPGALVVFAGVAVGLAAGKAAGITASARLAVAGGVASRPEGSSWPMVAAAATVGGIGFTVSLFIAELAFPPGAVQDAAKLGVLTGSIVAGVVGSVALRVVRIR